MHATVIHPSIHVASHTDHREFTPVEHLVVLRPAIGDAGDAGEPAAAALLLNLMARAARVAIVDDAPAVMVELHRGAQAIVLLEHTITATTHELVAAAARYYPRVTIWRSADAGAAGGGSLVRLGSTISVSAASLAGQAGHDTHDSLPPHDHDPLPPAEAGRSEALITEEELAMLMGPLPGPRTGADR